MEEKILKSFINFMDKMGEDVKELDLLVSIHENDEPELSCCVMEKQDNGRVWEVTYTKSGKVIDAFELL